MTTDSSANISTRTHKDYYTALHQAAVTFSSSLELEPVLQSIARVQRRPCR